MNRQCRGVLGPCEGLMRLWIKCPRKEYGNRSGGENYAESNKSSPAGLLYRSLRYWRLDDVGKGIPQGKSRVGSGSVVGREPPVMLRR